MFSYLRVCGLKSLASPGTIRQAVAIGLAMIGSLVVTANRAEAQLKDEPLIFDVRISLPMEPDEPTFHDFYINAGPEAGFKKGVFVNVVREIPVHDPIGNKQQATLNVKIGRLQIIHVERNITVGRLDEEFDDEDRPTVEYESVMIGDRIDINSITAEQPGQKKKAKVKQTHAAEAHIEMATPPASAVTNEASQADTQATTASTAATSSEVKAEPKTNGPASLPQKIPNVPLMPPGGAPSAVIPPPLPLPPKSA
jgi:hypothetical protein